MTIRHLKIFLEVANCKSMSQAASNLHFSQSSISQAIKELEKHYNTLLFHRLSKRLFITESGITLQTHAKAVVLKFDTLEAALKEKSTTKHIFLGATITCGCCILPSFLKEFQKKFSDISLTSSIHNTNIIEQKILNGQIDIALVEGKIANKDIISIPTKGDKLVLAFSVNHEFTSKKSFTAKDLTNREFVVREEGSGTRKSFDEYLQKYSVEIIPKVEAPFPEAMRHAIINNNCLAVMSQMLLENEIASGEIKTLSLSTDEWDRTFSIVYHKDTFLSDSIKKVISMLKDFN